MLVNEMIKQLEEIQEEYGDMDVKVWSSEFEEDNSIDVIGAITKKWREICKDIRRILNDRT